MRQRNYRQIAKHEVLHAKQRRNEQSAKSQKLSWDERKEMLTELICSATPPKTKPVIVNDRRTLCRGCEWARNEYCVLPSCFKEAIG